MANNSTHYQIVQTLSPKRKLVVDSNTLPHIYHMQIDAPLGKQLYDMYLENEGKKYGYGG